MRPDYSTATVTALVNGHRSAAESNPAISKRLKIQADGLKIVLNSTFGQTGNPYSVLYDHQAFLAVTGQVPPRPDQLKDDTVASATRSRSVIEWTCSTCTPCSIEHVLPVTP
jgi:hypothetical protein